MIGTHGALLAACRATYDPIYDEPGCVLEIDFSTATIVTSEASLTAPTSDFSSASWTKNQSTVTTDQDGVADKVEVAVGATDAYVSSAITNVQSSSTQVPLILTFKAKYVNVQWLVVESRNATAANQTFFDIQNGAVGTNGANHSAGSISAADGSGYRTISVQVNTNTGTNILRIHLSTADVTITVPVATTNVLLKEATATQIRLLSATNRKTGVVWSNATATTQFGYEATGFGGKPCIHGYGSQILVSSEAGVYGALGTDAPHTIFGVVKWDTTMDILSAWFGIGNSGTASSKTKLWGSTTTGTNRHRSIIVDDAGASFDNPASADNASPTADKVIEWYGPGTTESCQDNGAAANPNAASQDSGAITPNQSGIGCRPDSIPDNEIKGRIAVVAVWDTNKSAAARSRIRVYYGGKRGISVAA